jgi:hypothetical protein
MEKQKGGLHKQVAAIFEGLPGNEDRTSSSSGTPKQETAYRTSFPGNIAVMNAPQDSINGGGSVDVPVSNSVQPKKEVLNIPSRTLPVVQKPEAPKADKVEPRDRQNRIMLPASLTVKPSFKVVDKLKIKVAALVEQHGQMHLISLILMPFLAITMVFLLWRAFNPSSGPAQSTTDSATVVENAKNQLLLSWAKPTLFPENLRDPMKKYTSAQEISSTKLKSDLVINGIVYMEANPAESTALIGKRAVRIGDEISGTIVKDIQRDHLIFEIDGELVKRNVGR